MYSHCSEIEDALRSTGVPLLLATYLSRAVLHSGAKIPYGALELYSGGQFIGLVVTYRDTECLLMVPRFDKRNQSSDCRRRDTIKQARALRLAQPLNCTPPILLDEPSGSWLLRFHIRGLTLSDWRRTSDSPARLATCIRNNARLAHSLFAAVHESGHVLVDYKPKNVVVDRQGKQWFIDFGSVRRRHQHVRKKAGCGKLLYRAPELLLGGAAGPENDMFSFGATAWWILTARPPFTNAIADSLSASEFWKRCHSELGSLSPQWFPKKPLLSLLACLDPEPRNRPREIPGELLLLT